MMERLREGVNSIAVKIIIGLICLSFVFAGVGGYIASGNNNIAAKVNGTEIAAMAFEQAYANERNRMQAQSMQAQMGDYFSSLLADPAYVQSLRKSVLDRMVNDVLLEQYADSLGIRISDEQIRQFILNMPNFQDSDGKFDKDLYSDLLFRNGYNADSFAEYLRKDMARQQVQAVLQGSEFSLAGEVTAQSQLLNQNRDIRSITFDVQDFIDRIEMSAEELQQHYEASRDNYLRPEQVKVSYLELSAQELKSQVIVSEKQAKVYYEENLNSFIPEEQRELSHILVQDGDAAQAMLDELKSGADFVQLAQQKSEDISSSEQGGSLGWVTKRVMDPVFEEAAFALQNVGDITEVVKSDFGYHIIKLDGVKGNEAMPFEEVVAQIKSELADQEAMGRFYKLKAKLKNVAYESESSLDKSAEVTGQVVKKTDFISQQDAPTILQDPVVMDVILSPEVKENGLNSDVIEVAPEHVVVVRVEEFRDATVLPYEEVQEQVRAELLQLKGEQYVTDLAATVLEALKSGDESVVSSNGLAFTEIETIDRRAPLAPAAFAMAKPQQGGKTYTQTTDLDQNIVIVELSKVSISSDDSNFDAQIKMQLVRNGVEQDIGAMMNTLRKEADIKYYIMNSQP